MNITKEFEQIIFAAEEAGKIVKDYFGTVLKVEEKSMASDVKTKADTESEKVILKTLKKEYPDYDIFSEESGEDKKKSDHLIIIDPLDGSNNFVLGIPNFSISIALLRNNECIFGVTHNPITSETFVAEKGKGTWRNGKKVKVNSENKLSKSSIEYTCGYDNPIELRMKLYEKLLNGGTKRILDNWSPAYDFCLLASGKIEAIVNYKNDVYDFAAGKLIVQEAGGQITTWDGNVDNNPFNNVFLATNGTKIHSEILELLPR